MLISHPTRFPTQGPGNKKAIVAYDRDQEIRVPAHWQAVLDAVDDACWDAARDGATTVIIARRLDGLIGSVEGLDGSHTPRTLLRLLRRRGYVRTLTENADGGPRRWALTPAGRALTTRGRRT